MKEGALNIMADDHAAKPGAREEGEVLPEEELLYDLADLFKVFSDTTRIKILYTLMTDELSVNEIAEALGASQSAVSSSRRIWSNSVATAATSTTRSPTTTS